MPSNSLDYITIKGFKSIASIERLPLNPINVLIGANGSGKSNFLGAFSFLRSIREGRLQDSVTAMGGADKVLHFGSKTTRKIAFEISFKEGINKYRLELASTDDDALLPSNETVSSWDGNYLRPSEVVIPRNRREAGISGPVQDKPTKWVSARLDGWRLYHVHDTSSSSPMRKTASLDDNHFLRTDGSNLAAFLYYLSQMRVESYRLIRQTIQQVAPFFDNFRLAPLRLKPDDIKLEWQHKNSDQYFDASSLSDGTLRFMLLATLFLQPIELRPSTILVDEPELGLHPAAIGMLASLIKQAAVDTQVIVSTQSSLLLDYFQPEEVLVANRVDGGTEISHLDSARLREWLGEYSMGQLWEKNELGGRPA